MDVLARRSDDRRRARRGGPGGAGWKAEAVLRPGLLVRVINIGPYGALVESQARLRPGRLAELQLIAADADVRQLVPGRIERCEVVRLEPLLFQGAIAFERALPG
jgi:hypothetical protein